MKNNKKIISSFKKNSSITAITIAIISFFLFYGAFQDDNKAKLLSAEKYYKTAFFDKAIEVLTPLSIGHDIDIEIQKDALRLLGRAYTAKGLYDRAKEAILKLLELEPPIVELNPDREPPPLMKVYYEARKSFSGSYKVEREDPGIKTMAIIDFKNRSIDRKEQFDPMEKGFADLLIHRMNNATGLKVIERERIKWILNEINIQDQYSMEGAVRIGKQLGVHTILLGSFIIYDDELWLGARLVKVETSEILLTDEVKGEVDDFFDLTSQLSNKIAAKVDVALSDVVEEALNETQTLDAMMSYSEGLTFLELGKFKEAYDKFMEALKFDPDYEKAKIKAESIKPLLS